MLDQRTTINTKWDWLVWDSFWKIFRGGWIKDLLSIFKTDKWVFFTPSPISERQFIPVCTRAKGVRCPRFHNAPQHSVPLNWTEIVSANQEWGKTELSHWEEPSVLLFALCSAAAASTATPSPSDSAPFCVFFLLLCLLWLRRTACSSYLVLRSKWNRSWLPAGWTSSRQNIWHLRDSAGLQVIQTRKGEKKNEYRMCKITIKLSW